MTTLANLTADLRKPLLDLQALAAKHPNFPVSGHGKYNGMIAVEIDARDYLEAGAVFGAGGWRRRDSGHPGYKDWGKEHCGVFLNIRDVEKVNQRGLMVDPNEFTRDEDQAVS